MPEARCDFCDIEVVGPEQLQPWAVDEGVSVLCAPCKKYIDDAVVKMRVIADKALLESRLSLYKRLLRRGLRRG